ncbi:MAG: bactofilin family protein [Hyphomicrobium sp.]
MFVVDIGTIMRGNIVAAGTIKLDGWLEGDVVCSRLEIGVDGYLLGRVTAKEIFVHGQIVGTAAADGVHLLPGAFVEGDVFHRQLSVEPGATLSGKAKRIHRVLMPEEFLALEARAVSEHAHLDRAERQSLRSAANRAVVEYPRYQQAKARFAVRPQRA